MTWSQRNRSGMFGLGLSVVAALVAAGCGSSVIGGTGAGSSAGGAGAGGGSTGGSSTASCAALVANATTTAVTVRFVNDTAGDLYIPFSTWATCSGELPWYTVTDPSQKVLSTTTSSCNSTCESFSCNCLTTYTCMGNAPLTRVTPHGTVSVEWTGGVLETRTLPTACTGDNSCSGSSPTQTCVAWIKPPAYPLTFTAQAWPDLTCSGTGCACTPNASGSCVVPATWNVSPTGTAVQGIGSFAEGGTSVDILFK